MSQDQEPIPEVFLSAIESEVLAAIEDDYISSEHTRLLAKHCKLSDMQVIVAVQLLKYKGII